MAYENLTAEQKAAIQNVLTPLIRPSVAELRRIVNMWKEVLALYNDAGSDFRLALNALAATDVIPNVGGLAGASGIKKSELTNPVGGILADMQAVVTTWEEATRLALCVKLGGVNLQ